MELHSPAFRPGEKIPKRFSVDGERISPPLQWTDAPEGATEFAVMLEDLDARHPRPFIHWLVYKIPREHDALPEGIKHLASVKVPETIRQGMNSLEGNGYQPPGAPFGRRHRLMFHLYALDAPLPDRPGLHLSEFHEAAAGHVLAEATLPAIYVREER